ncbi:hypothetical protein Lfu02_18330 [Longispora fulva]|uniref:Uncharacterized protein n=1 Tax=Longispora fulva TaxID=619741 RepID=A0A8J7KZ45_9ACTN|nr:hypothetical protein [Longispora fulva]MBG6140162.1 hypothetical protein [Longispora fulva]GIG57461.1 hypothetical protein Lfu02_18330 [Longispora fulva]
MKPHRLDSVSLVFGVLFLALTGWWVLGQVAHVSGSTLAWTGAAGLVGIGVLGIATSIIGNRTRPEDRPDEPVDI